MVAIYYLALTTIWNVHPAAGSRRYASRSVAASDRSDDAAPSSRPPSMSAVLSS